MKPIHELGVFEAAQAIRQGKLRAVQLVQACIDRIEAREPQVGAWECWDGEAALRAAHECDRAPATGWLHGIPIGVKDIIDTERFPTGRGSPIYRGVSVPWDAACVSLAQRAGAIVLGKTVTTEFAYFTPGKTANPRHLGHTPGGSSSGSAAAVADAMVPVAFGSQTAGSLIRPASYCGITGYKPTFGHFPLAGIRPLAHSLDTLGVLTRSVVDAALMRAVLLETDFDADALSPDGSTPRIGLCRTPSWLQASAYVRSGLEETTVALARGRAQVGEADLPEICAQMVESQKCVMAYEAAQNMAYEHDCHFASLSPAIRDLLQQGRTIGRDEYLLSQAAAERARAEMARLFEKWDVLLTPAAPGEAPAGLQATGDPLFSRMWTLLGLPCLTLPAFKGPGGLPVGLQLVAAHGEDERLLRAACWVERELAFSRG